MAELWAVIGTSERQHGLGWKFLLIFIVSNFFFLASFI